MNEQIIDLCILLDNLISLLGARGHTYDLYENGKLLIKQGSIHIDKDEMILYIYHDMIVTICNGTTNFSCASDPYITIEGYDQQKTITLLDKIATRLQTRFYVN